MFPDNIGVLTKKYVFKIKKNAQTILDRANKWQFKEESLIREL